MSELSIALLAGGCIFFGFAISAYAQHEEDKDIENIKNIVWEETGYLRKQIHEIKNQKHERREF